MRGSVRTELARDCTILRNLIARHARPDDTTAIEGMLLSAAGRAGEPRASTTGTVFALIVQGSKRLAIGDRVYDYGPGQYLVASGEKSDRLSVYKIDQSTGRLGEPSRYPVGNGANWVEIVDVP